MKKKTCIIIAGPTAVGKTALAIALAKTFNTEIISADSRQCYKELNIGVAKPSLSELAQVRHHFINSHSINDIVNAVVFEKYALQKANELFATQDVIVMVGGTGLYIKAFCEGLDDIPAIPAVVRQELTEAYEAKGMEWLQAEVKQQDHLFYEKGEIKNPQRLLRALEVKMATGRSITEFQQKTLVERDFNIVKIGLELPREILYERINKRVEVMVEDGLIEEVRSLLPYQQLNALQTVGYTELFDHFNGLCSTEASISHIQQHTRQYAKRQLTWFKKDAAFSWFNAGDNSIISAITKSIEQ